jgi:anti-sigma regulatory factor (Ser/Thr protein kinase)
MKLTLGNSITEVSRLCNEIERFCEQEHLPQVMRHDVLLILDELVTNIIVHGFSSGIGKSIHVCLNKDSNNVHIEVSDDAPAFNPIAVEVPDIDTSLEDRPIGGLGIHLMKQFSKQMTYQRKDNHNVLTFRIAIAKQ